MLQAQKFVDLEGITGAEMKAVEEPEGETIMGSGREALRPPGINIISFSSKFPLFLDVSGQHPPFHSLLHQELFGH